MCDETFNKKPKLEKIKIKLDDGTNSEEEYNIYEKVRDHCHITGEFRGAAHKKCNLLCSLKQIQVPVVFHNLKGYDSQYGKIFNF